MTFPAALEPHARTAAQPWPRRARHRLPADSTVMDAEQRALAGWAERWMQLARYAGRELPDPSWRTDRLVALWREAVPGNWRRGDDKQLLDLGGRYRRTHKYGTPKP